MSLETILQAQDSPPPPGWSRARRRFALALLGGSAILNLIDRQIVSILIEPIKREFHATDTQIGLLTGAVFALCYAFAAFPLARLLDTGIRRTVFSACLALWSVSTMLAGLATSFGMLLMTRLGVAVGESGATPAQQSLAADLYPGRKLPMAMAAINFCSAIGVALSLLAGGWMSEHLGWRTALIVVGAPGVVLAVIMRLAMPEPARRTMAGVAAVDVKPPIGEVVRHLWSLRTYRALLVVMAGGAFSGFSLLVWGPSFLIRVHGMSPSWVGLWFGLAAAGGLGIGSVISGRLSPALARRDIRWYLRLGGVCALVAATGGLTMAVSPNAWVAVFGGFIYNFFITIHVPSIMALIQGITPSRMRGTAAAGGGFLQVVGGAGLGPFITGVLNDAFLTRYGAEGIRHSLAWVMLGAVMAGLLMLIANRWVPSEYARATEVGSASA